MKNNTLETICGALIYICLILPIKICIIILLLPFILLAMCMGVEFNKGWNKTFKHKK